MESNMIDEQHNNRNEDSSTAEHNATATASESAKTTRSPIVTTVGRKDFFG